MTIQNYEELLTAYLTIRDNSRKEFPNAELRELVLRLGSAMVDSHYESWALNIALKEAQDWHNINDQFLPEMPSQALQEALTVPATVDVQNFENELWASGVREAAAQFGISEEEVSKLLARRGL